MDMPYPLILMLIQSCGMPSRELFFSLKLFFDDYGT
jgi:hypothetical protein